jgi:dipeptidyl aminopeptidase/acylaminoacyl peptidase
VIYPTGSGEAVRLNVDPLDRVTAVEWFPDGKRLLLCGTEPSHASRCYALNTSGGRPTPVTGDCQLASIAPDGRTVLLTMQDGSRQLASIDGGTARPLPAVQSGDRQIAWTRDSQAIYVQRGTDIPAIVDRIDLASGARTMVRQLAPPDVSTLAAISVADWIDDGRGYVYNYTSLTSTLFLVTGAID